MRLEYWEDHLEKIAGCGVCSQGPAEPLMKILDLTLSHYFR